MKDRADFARKGIARGRSVAVVRYADGVLFVSENPSAALHKISEIYDRIAFAAVGRYNEFENLRIAGVRLADMRGYSYDRRDVTGRGPGQRLRPDAGHDLLQRGREALRDRDLRGGGGRHPRGRPDLPADLRRPGRRGARLRRHGWRRRGGDGVPRGALHPGPVAQRGPGPRCGRARPERDRSPRRPRARPGGRGARPHPHPGAQVQASGHARAGRDPGRQGGGGPCRGDLDHARAPTRRPDPDDEPPIAP